MTRTGRPGGVTLVALLNLLSAIGYALAISPWDPFQDSAILGRLVPVATMQQTGIITGLIAIGALLHLLAAIGLFLLKPWGWRLALLLTGLGLAIYLTVFWLGSLAPLRLAIYAAVAFYLNTARVRDVFLSSEDVLAPRRDEVEAR